MSGTIFLPARSPLMGRVRVPGDKSISHRSVLLGAVNDGPVEVSGFLRSADTLATVAAVRALGVRINDDGPSGDHLVVHGVGWDGLQEPSDVLDVANAGTLIRLLPGILASTDLFCVLTGDQSIRRRPMARVLRPLAEMGAATWARDGGRLPPVAIRGNRLHGIDHSMEVASAQVKSCLILAGLRADSATVIHEPGPSRDHTETMVRYGGGMIERQGDPAGRGATTVWPLKGGLNLGPINVPGDFSSAAFLLVAALLVPGSRLTVERIGLNPTRTGLLEALLAMGARLAIDRSDLAGPEPIGAVTADYSELTGTDVGADLLPLMIDEVPIWALAAARAHGISRLRGAQELRVKESDRLAATAELLRALDVGVEETEDGLIIEGRPEGWSEGRVRSYADHRLAMVGAVAGLASEEGVEVDDAGCMAVSFPGFAATIQAITER